MTSKLVLSLFPGIDLLGAAFEELGFCVVRGPDLLWGGDVHTFRPPRDVFAGVIGGPPCQKHSNASEIVGTSAVDLIPEYMRIVDLVRPAWAVMENVRGTMGHPSIPRAWHPVKLNDWHCGGLTSRTRLFYCWPFFCMEPSPRPGDPSPSVMASTHKRGASQYVSDKGFLRGDLPLSEYARLQGAEKIGETIERHNVFGRKFGVHVLGNGVPLPMGRIIARAVLDTMYVEKLGGGVLDNG